MYFIYICIHAHIFYLFIYIYICILYTYIYVFGEGNGNPLQYSCLENLMDRGAWQATYSPWGHKESDTTEGLILIYIYIISDIFPESDLSIGIRFSPFFPWPPCGMQDLNSLTKNQTCAPCNGSLEC